MKVTMKNHDRLHKQQEDWETMQRIGHLRYFIQNLLAWIGCFATGAGVFALLKALGWLHGSGMSLVDILVCGGFTGGVWSELHWTDMKRKFRIPPPEEDWMAR